MQRQTNVLFNVTYDNTSDDELAAGVAPLDDFEDNLLGIAWLYNSANINPLSISPVDGMNLRLVAEDSDALNSDFSGQVYTLDCDNISAPVKRVYWRYGFYRAGERIGRDHLN